MKREQVLALYDAYADSVYRTALGYLRSPHDAEDAVQAVFCKLLEQEGIPLARRTVAKYRSELGIGSSTARRARNSMK